MTEMAKRVMVSIAHPDDAEFGAGGTIAKWAKEGSEVLLVVGTNGDKGSGDPAMTSEKLARIREQEEREAAKALGISEVVFLGYPDGGLDDTREYRGKIVFQIRRFRPDIIITPDPHRLSHNHRDHRMAGLVTMDAVYPYARDHLHFPEQLTNGLQPFKVGEVYLLGAENPDEYIDISETLEQKIAALRCHASQFLDRSRDISVFVREGAQRTGEKAGLPYAEAFRKVTMRR